MLMKSNRLQLLRMVCSLERGDIAKMKVLQSSMEKATSDPDHRPSKTKVSFSSNESFDDFKFNKCLRGTLLFLTSYFEYSKNRCMIASAQNHLSL